MALQNRKTARADLATRIVAACPALQAFYAQAPKDSRGESPVGWLESLGMPVPRSAEENVFRFAVVFLVNRANAAEAEDLLDDICFQFISLAESLNGLVIEAPSDTDIIDLDNDAGQVRAEIFTISYLYEGV
jgi:hypothetical protein